MAGYTLVDFTSYNVNAGICMVDGTEYQIKKGKTLVNGTVFDVSFHPSIKIIPGGRVIGDVDGNGKITSADATLVFKFINGGGDLDETQKKCADADQNGSIGEADFQIIANTASRKIKLGSYSRDILGNWFVNPNYESEDGQFYIQLNDNDVGIGSNIEIEGDESDRVVKTETMPGAIKIFMTVPPINPMTYTVV